MRRLSDLLAPTGIVGTELSIAQIHGLPRFGPTEVENRSEPDVEAVKVTWQEVIGRQPLPASHAVELVGNCLDVEPEVKGGEAVRRIPPAAVDARTRSRTWIRPDGHVAECDCLERRRPQSIDSGDELLRRHVLGEHAFGEGVDRSKHSTELAFPKQIDGLVMVERRVRGEEPVVSGGRPQRSREALQHRDELEEALPCVWSGGGLLVEPPRDGSRIRFEDTCQISTVERDTGRSAFESFG